MNMLKSEALYELSALTHRSLTIETVLYELSYCQLEALASKWGEDVRKKNGITLTDIKLGMKNAREEECFLNELRAEAQMEKRKYIF